MPTSATTWTVIAGAVALLALRTRGTAHLSHPQRLHRSERVRLKMARLRAQTVAEVLRRELYAGADPYTLAVRTGARCDFSYQMSQLKPTLVRKVLTYMRTPPALWLEVGTYLGTSALVVAAVAQELGLCTSVVCIDTWCGDANMWMWHKAKPMGDLLKMDRATGDLGIYRSFLANVIATGHTDRILPLRVSSIVGFRLLRRLVADKRLRHRPGVIYLDSAHEEGETHLEVAKAWEALETDGVLFGDDWCWKAVRDDVSAFVTALQLPPLPPCTLRHFGDSESVEQVLPGLLLVGAAAESRQWLVIKAAA